MTSSNAWAKHKKHILLKKFGSKKKVNQFWPVYVILQNTKLYQKSPQNLQPENQFHALLYSQRIKHNLYCKMKLLKQATYITYVLATLLKFVF